MNLDVTCILLLLNILNKKVLQVYFFEVLDTQSSQVLMQSQGTKAVGYCMIFSDMFFIVTCLANWSDISFQ